MSTQATIRFAEFGLEKNGYVLFVGLLKPDKGVHTLVEAYASLETELPLVIVGDSPDPGDYVQRLKSTPDERIRFLGYVYGAKVKELFANCLIYVQPSLMEGNSPALMTAMACGRAVVVSDIEQNVETIGDAGATFVVEDPLSLARVLTALIGDPAGGREARRDLARVRIETVYDWDHVIDQTDSLFRRISIEGTDIVPRLGNDWRRRSIPSITPSVSGSRSCRRRRSRHSHATAIRRATVTGINVWRRVQPRVPIESCTAPISSRSMPRFIPSRRFRRQLKS